MKKIIGVFVLVVLFLFPAVWQVEAVPFPGLVKFPGTNVWWCQDANLAATLGYNPSGYFIPGGLTWDEAMGFTEYLNTIHFGGWTGWRLPTTSDFIIGYNITTGEMGHLFYNDLGGTAGESLPDTTTLWKDYFGNLQSNGYWYGVKDPNYGNIPLTFHFSDGSQNRIPSSFKYYAWPVISDSASAVPEPASLFLISSGLLGLLALTRRQRRS